MCIAKSFFKFNTKIYEVNLNKIKIDKKEPDRGLKPTDLLFYTDSKPY